MLTETELLATIDNFRQQNGDMTETQFGMKAVGDFNFVSDLRTGARSPRLKTVRKVIAFMDNYQGRKK
jgi:hypothetical protein